MTGGVSASKPKLVVIGNGMAGVRCVEEIGRLAPDLYDITIFGNEPRPNYNRILLSKVLQGDASFDDVVTHDWAWYQEQGIRLHAGHPVVRIDASARRVETSTGLFADYDRLIVATGSSAFIPPLPGVGKPGVIAFRNVDDCRTMMEAAAVYRKAAVIGGGLLGLEAARGLLNLGMEVTVVHNAAYLMNRQLDRTSAEMLQRELERQGMRFLLGKITEKIVGRKRAEGLAFSDGSKLQADLIVMAVGIRPNVEVAKAAGIRTNRAIVVNDYLETSCPGVYAVGECAEHDGTVYGLVAPLFEQGKVLAKVLCGMETEPYRGSVPYAQLKVSGVDVFSAGAIGDPDAETVLQQFDGIKGTYKRVLSKNGKVAGAILYGDTAEGNSLLGYLKRGADAVSRSDSRPENGGGSDAVAAMPDEETVCNCNAVSKAAIAKAVREGANTVELVRDRTKASGSCGGCKPLVAAVVKHALAGGGSAGSEREEDAAVCGCTTLGHAALKEEIAARGFSDAAQAMAGLGWTRPDGCPACRAAIRYYLGSAEAAEAAGAVISAGAVAMPVSAAAAEAMTAAAEGAIPGAAAAAEAGVSAEERTTVTPKLLAGVVRADQLRRIADTIERYGLSFANLTGEGRIDLPGVPVEAVGALRETLGLPIETAGGIGREARILIGARSGKDAQTAARIGTELERRLHRLRLPSSVTAAVVAGFADNASGLLVRDIGLAEAPAGWEIYAGGRSERPIRQAQLIAVEPDEEAALEIAVSCLQWYRESAYYGEPVWKWLDRIGLVAVREKLLDPDRREELLGRWFGERHPSESAVPIGI